MTKATSGIFKFRQIGLSTDLLQRWPVPQANSIQKHTLRNQTGLRCTRIVLKICFNWWTEIWMLWDADWCYYSLGGETRNRDFFMFKKCRGSQRIELSKSQNVEQNCSSGSTGAHGVLLFRWPELCLAPLKLARASSAASVSLAQALAPLVFKNTSGASFVAHVKR